MKNIFFGNVKNGILKAKGLKEWIIKQEGKKIDIFVEVITGKRSEQANRYMWPAVIRAISKHTGNSEEWTHRFFEEKFLGREWVTMGKERQLIQKTCSMLKSGEFQEFINECKLWAIEELGCQFSEDYDPPMRNL